MALLGTQNAAPLSRTVPTGTFFFLREHNTNFSSLAASAFDTVSLLWDGVPQAVEAQTISPDYCTLFGFHPILGRTFSAEDEQPGNETVVLISATFWRDRFASSPAAIGAKLLINGREHRIVGVVPRLGDGQQRVALWRPLAATDARRRDFTYASYRVHGRLRDAATVAAAQTELDSLARQLETEQPDQVRHWRPLLKTWRADFSAPVQPMLGLIAGAAIGAVLLAALNASGLVLTQFARSQRDIAVRFALGARRRDLLGQFLRETMVLAFGGAFSGLAAAAALHDGIQRWEPEWFVSSIAPEFGWRAVSCATLIALVSAFFMLAEVSRRLALGDWQQALRQSAIADRHLWRFQRILASAQIALGFALALNAGLLVQTWQRIARTDAGFDPERLQFVFFRPSTVRYDTPAKQAQFATEVVASVRRIAGIESAAITTTLPLSPFLATTFALPGQQVKSWAELPRASYAAVTPEYFATAQIKLWRGRTFSDADHADSQRVAIINRTLARQHFGDQDPVGKWIMPSLPPHKWRLIIGVVEDVIQENIVAQPVPQIYEPFAQAPYAVVGLIFRHASGAPPATVREIQRAISTVDPAQAAGLLQRFSDVIARQTGKQRFAAFSLILIAGFSLLLATAGVAAVMSLAATQRTREFGVRVALGATSRAIAGLVIRECIALAAAGLASGAFLGWALGIAASALAPDITGIEFAPVATATVLVVACALGATIAPALRAARVDPAISLRSE